jgi:PAS domain S-box-containing protein
LMNRDSSLGTEKPERRVKFPSPAPVRYSLSNLPIKQRLPLLIGTLLFVIFAASAVASYREVRESGLEVGRERLLSLTQQLANQSQQSLPILLNRTFTVANDPAIRVFLNTHSSSTQSGAVALMQQFAAGQDPSSLQIELWTASGASALILPEGSSPEPADLTAEFKQSAADPFKALGPIRAFKDTTAYPAVAAVKDDAGNVIGYFVRWRRVSPTPNVRKQLADLLGSQAAVYYGNSQGDVWTDLEKSVPKPPVSLASTLEVTHYIRDGNSVMALGRPINGTPWSVVVEFPDQAFLSQAHHFLRRMLLIGFALLVVGVAGAFALSRSITKPLHSLKRAAAAISGGDYSRTVNIRGNDELGELAAAFNSMADQVRDSQVELERKLHALEESEHRLQTVIENLSEGLVVSDLDGQLLHWNRAAMEIHGFASIDECLLKLPEFANIFELSNLNGSVFDLDQWPLPRIIRGESLRNFEVRIRRLEGDWSRVFNYGGAIVQEAGGRLVAIVTMSDITDRKRAEEDRQASELRYRRLFESAQDGILILDADSGLIVDVNPYLSEMLGFSKDELTGKELWEIGPFKDIVASQVAFAQLRERGYIRYENLPLESREGLIREVEFVSNSYVAGKSRVIQCNVRDNTERKLAEKEIRRLNEELEQRVAQRTAELSAVNKELEAFSYSVSHDLRAPLRHINGFSQALLEDYFDKLDETGKGYLKEVRSASQEMAQLIDDVLQLARVTRSEMRREVINLSEVAQSVVGELQKAEPLRAVTINLKEGLSTQGDKRLLRIVLSNLLGNAWKFSSKEKQAEITLGGEQRNGEFSYFVRDNGAGFDMTYVNKLFGAFQRLHTAAEFEGTGIGLATVQRIINRHGGRVWAEGTVNEGATFYFTLPDFKEIKHGGQSDPTSGRQPTG